MTRLVRPGLAGLIGLLVVVAMGCSSGSGTFELGDAGKDAATHRYTIPAGAGEAIDRGEPLDILPARLDVHVGDVIEIDNHDDRGHLIGPFFVAARATVRQRFATPGRYTGACTVHSSGTIVIVVT